MRIPERNVVARLRRALAKEWDGMRGVRVNRREPDHQTGRYLYVDFQHNLILDLDMDLEAYARELGCLRPQDEVIWADEAERTGAR